MALSSAAVIEAVCVNFERTTGKVPQNLYLGHEDWYELRSTAHLLIYQHSPGGRERFRGMAIYIVNADKHISVS